MVDGMSASDIVNESLVEIDENEDDPMYNPLDNWLTFKIHFIFVKIFYENMRTFCKI